MHYCSMLAAALAIVCIVLAAFIYKRQKKTLTGMSKEADGVYYLQSGGFWKKKGQNATILFISPTSVSWSVYSKDGDITSYALKDLAADGKPAPGKVVLK